MNIKIHEARDKAHSISTGVTQNLTKQQVDGRSRREGYVLEVEKNCLIAHGASFKT